MSVIVPRIMIAGTNSGSGKTTIVCGILAALKQMGKQAASCKCGPDYIDPMFHRQIFGVPSQNLDLFFAGREGVRYLMTKQGKGTDITVVEGVMGFYDGLCMDKEEASSYDLAKQTDTPVILVVNCRGMALSVLPLIKGFLEFRKDHTIKGVILNGVSKMAGEKMKEMIERELKVKVYGCIPVLKELKLASRHLGLVTPCELADIQKDMETLGKIMQENLLMRDMLDLARQALPLPDKMPAVWEKELSPKKGKGLRIATGMDKAFCFYYKDNLEILQEMGCELVCFSPMEDDCIPENVDALILGGGYPEVYAKELSENVTMRKSIKNAVKEGLPCLAECGGFMYLHEELEDENGAFYPMAGVIKGKAANQKKLVRFGYINVKANRKNAYLKKNEVIKAHEFHYWDSTNNGEDFLAAKPSGKREWLCVHAEENLLAGYPHLYFYSNLKVLLRFLEKCWNYHNGNGK